MVSPQVSWAVLGGHLDLVGDGESLVGDPAAAASADLPAVVIPTAGFAEVREDVLDFLVRSLGPTGGCPLGQSLGVGDGAAHESRRCGRFRGLG